MTKIIIKLRPLGENVPGNIVYIVTKDKVTKKIATEYHVFPQEWNSKNSTIISSTNKNLLRISSLIEQDYKRLEMIVKNFDSLGRYYQPSDVVAEFIRKKEEDSFFIFMNGIILRLKQLNRYGTALNYKSALNSFRKFRENNDIKFDEINTSIIEEYEAYLFDRGLTPNSTSFYMRILRAVYNRAVENEIILDHKPFKKVFTGMERTCKRAIGIKELKRLRELDLSKNPRLELSRDTFLFLFFCRGMSFIDAAFLKDSNLRSGVLTYRRHKTNQLLQIKVVRQIKDIIEQYHVKDSPYIFPFISKEKTDAYKQYHCVLHKINRDLKLLGQMIGLSRPLTTYVSRHAWATIAKQKKIPLTIISEALGHDSEKTTRIYLDSLDTATIDKANDMIISCL